MNSCQVTRDRLMSVLDAGGSTPPEAVRRHLSGCARCRAWWEQVRQVETLLRESGEATPPAPASLLRRIVSGLEEERVPPRQWGGMRRLRWPAVAAALVVLAGGSVAILLSRSAQSSRSLPVAKGPGQTVTMPSLSALPSLGSLLSVPPPVEEARRELTWLKQAVVSNTQSAARAFSPVTHNPKDLLPTSTKSGRNES